MQYSNQSNKEENKNIRIGKKEKRLFEEDVLFCIENPIESTDKPEHTQNYHFALIFGKVPRMWYIFTAE